MANYQYTSDLVADVLFRAGEPNNGSSDFAAVALTYLNRAYQALLMGGGEIDPDCNEDWWWARRHPPGSLNLSSTIQTGTVTVTNGSAGIVLSNPPAFAAEGYFIRIGDHPDIFRTFFHIPSSVDLTLDGGYTGPSGTFSYRMFKAEYNLAADVLRVCSPMRIFQGSGYEVNGVELTALERDWPLQLIEAGAPSLFAFVGETKVRFNRYGPLEGSTPNLIRVEYDYIYRPSDLSGGANEEPIVPRQYRKLLADIAVTFLFVDKNDDRASSVSGLAKKGLQAMVKEQRSRMVNYSRTLGAITPRIGQLSTWRRPIRTESGFIIG